MLVRVVALRRRLTAYRKTGRHFTQFRLLKPAKIEPGKTYPVVLYLHVRVRRGDDNRSQLKYFPHWISEPGATAKSIRAS